MPRILSDPGRDVLPDHAGPDHDIVRGVLVQTQTVADNEAAVTFLDDAWVASIAKRKALWTIQEAEDSAAVLVELAQAEKQQQDEEEAILAEIEAKRPKSIPVDFTRQIGDSIIRRPSSYALNLIRRNTYCPLWYFTDTALNEAAKIATMGPSEDSYSLHTTDSKVVIKSSNSSQSASPNALRDRDLDWREFSLAQDIFLQQIVIARWADDRITMTRQFFEALNKHPMRHLSGGKGDTILLHYQGAARQQWHDDIDYASSWDLSSINENLLAKFKLALHDDTEDAKSAAVSLFLCFHNRYTILTDLLPLLIIYSIHAPSSPLPRFSLASSSHLVPTTCFASLLFTPLLISSLRIPLRFASQYTLPPPTERHERQESLPRRPASPAELRPWRFSSFLKTAAPQPATKPVPLKVSHEKPLIVARTPPITQRARPVLSAT